MSLINDALKKAQKQREGEIPPLPVKPQDVPIPASPKRRSGPSPVVLGFAMGLVLMVLMMVGGASVYLIMEWRKSPGEVASVGPIAEVQTTHAEQVRMVDREPVEEVLETVSQESPGQGSRSSAVPSQATTRDPESTAVPRMAVPLEPPEVERKPEVELFLRNVNISARAAGSDSRAAIDGTIFYLGDLVLPEYGLRLIEVTPTRILFQDRDGATYQRRL